MTKNINKQNKKKKEMKVLLNLNFNVLFFLNFKSCVYFFVSFEITCRLNVINMVKTVTRKEDDKIFFTKKACQLHNLNLKSPKKKYTLQR